MARGISIAAVAAAFLVAGGVSARATSTPAPAGGAWHGVAWVPDVACGADGDPARCVSPDEAANASWPFTANAAPSATPLAYPLENGDEDPGVPDADVDAAAAWEITRGDPSVIVAVVDTGVDVNHPELAPAIWTNPGEIPGNGIDDDGDGLIDDVHGWDFADQDDDPIDLADPHGTLVAGLVAGQQTGLAPDVTILPVKIFSSTGSDPDFEAVASSGIEFALAKGARVIQISWELFSPPGAQLDAAFADAEAADALVVVAAGNDGENLTVTPRYPTALSYSNIVGVAGTDRYDRPVDVPGLFVTNYGVTWVELAAPTEKVVSTFPGTGGHLLFSGTSASAPLVSAAAALAWSVDPSLSASQVRQMLIDGSDRLPTLEAKVLGSGRLDAGNVVRLAAAAAAAGGGAGAAGPPRAVVGPIARAEPGVPALFDGTQSFAAIGASGTALTATWSFGDGVAFEDGAPLLAEHTWSEGGDWPATLEVADARGLTHVARRTVSIAFRGDAIAQSIASAHPYPGGTQQVEPLTFPGAAWIRLHFSRIETPPGDALIVYDGARTALRSWQGSFTDVTTDPIRGDSAFVYLRGFSGGTYGFDLDRVEVEAPGESDRAPVVRTNAPVSIVAGREATLSAEDSFDPDGDPLAFAWRLVQAPQGSMAALSTTSGAVVTFTPDRHGAYAFAVTADDGTASSSRLAWIVTRTADAQGCDCRIAAPQTGVGEGRADRGRGAVLLLSLPVLGVLLLRRRRARTPGGSA